MRLQKEFLLVLILLFLYSSCKRTSEQRSHHLDYSSQDSVKIDVRIYDVNKTMYPILDSIIASIENCNSEIDNPGKFVCYVDLDKDTTKVTLENIKFRNINYSNFEGVFLHNSFEFYLEGEVINSLFESKDKYLCFKTTPYNKDLIDIDDSGSMWVYVYRNDLFKCILYSNCNSSWFDESYFVPEEEQ